MYILLYINKNRYDLHGETRMLDHLTKDFKVKIQYNLEVNIITDKQFNPAWFHTNK